MSLQAAQPVSASQHRGYLTRLTVISTLGGPLFGYDTGAIRAAVRLTCLPFVTPAAGMFLPPTYGSNLHGGPIALVEDAGCSVEVAAAPGQVRTGPGHQIVMTSLPRVPAVKSARAAGASSSGYVR